MSLITLILCLISISSQLCFGDFIRSIYSPSTIPIIHTLPSSLPPLAILHHPFPTAWFSFLTQHIRSMHAWPPSLSRTHRQTHAPIFVKLIPPCLHGRAWPHEAAIPPSHPCNIHANTHISIPISMPIPPLAIFSSLQPRIHHHSHLHVHGSSSVAGERAAAKQAFRSPRTSPEPPLEYGAAASVRSASL